MNCDTLIDCLRLPDTPEVREALAKYKKYREVMDDLDALREILSKLSPIRSYEVEQGKGRWTYDIF